MLSAAIFRQYDIRGKVEVEFDLDGAGRIAAAFAHYAREKGFRQVLVGRDNRKSSLAFRDRVAEVLTGLGMYVVDMGEVITPMFYFANHYLQIKEGMMIDASHNPGYDNGFKLLIGNSTIFGEEIQKIAKLAMAEDSVIAV